MHGRLLVPLLMAALVLAGCANPSKHDASPSVPVAPVVGAPDPAGSAAVVAATGWSIDCGLGAFEAGPWAQTCEARASHTQGPKEETWAAVNPKDVNNVVIGAKDLNPDSSKGCVWNGVFVTKDGGRTWTDVTIGGTFASRQSDPTNPFFGYACNTDPMFQFTSDGSLHYAVEEYNLMGQNAYGPLPVNPTSDALAAAAVIPGWKIVLATSHDGGLTWPDLITYQPDLAVVTDYSRMAVSPTAQSILEIINSEAGGCHLLASRDGGKSADLFHLVLTQSGSTPCEAISASPKGVVVVAGSGVAPGEAGGNRVIVARSTDDGRTFLESSPGFTYKRIDSFKESHYRVGSGLELAYDLSDSAHRGTLYATYAAADRDEADVFVRSSGDDGKTWSDAVLVNDDGAGTHQWMPNVAVAGDGSVHVFFMDKRYDARHTLIDITHAVSLDGGRTWTNERVSTVSYNGELGRHQEGFPFIGDYLGVAAVGNDVWAGFPDASNGKETVIAAAHIHHA